MKNRIAIPFLILFALMVSVAFASVPSHPTAVPSIKTADIPYPTCGTQPDGSDPCPTVYCQQCASYPWYQRWLCYLTCTTCQIPKPVLREGEKVETVKLHFPKL